MSSCDIRFVDIMPSAADMRILTLWLHYIRTSLIRHMEFRAQFFVNVALGFVWLGFMFFTAHLFFLHTNEIHGWTEIEVDILITSWAIVGSCVQAFFWAGLSEMTAQITNGRFDFYFVRPVHALWQIIFSRFQPAQVVEMCAYGILLVLFLAHSAIDVTFIGLTIYIALLFCALLIRLSILLMLETLSFWFVNIENVKYLYYSIVDVGRYPTVIFRSAEVLFLTVIPIAYLGNVQTLFLVGEESWQLLIATLLVTVISVSVATGFFHWGARRYSSASS